MKPSSTIGFFNNKNLCEVSANNYRVGIDTDIRGMLKQPLGVTMVVRAARFELFCLKTKFF